MYLAGGVAPETRAVFWKRLGKLPGVVVMPEGRLEMGREFALLLYDHACIGGAGVDEKVCAVASSAATSLQTLKGVEIVGRRGFGGRTNRTVELHPDNMSTVAYCCLLSPIAVAVVASEQPVTL